MTHSLRLFALLLIAGCAATTGGRSEDDTVGAAGAGEVETLAVAEVTPEGLVTRQVVFEPEDLHAATGLRGIVDQDQTTVWSPPSRFAT